MTIFYIFIFLFGLIAGSFLNCVIYRLESGESFLRGRSYCPHCRRQLGWKDLIPVFSFLFLGRKCRYCKKPISLQYPLVELATGFLFVFIILETATMVAVSSFYYLVISGFLIVIFVYDLKHYLIPDRVVYPAIILVFSYHLFRVLNLGFVSDFGFRISDFKTLANPLSAAIIASGFFLSIVLVSRGKWMGAGDIKLAFLMGLILGWPNILVALFLAFLIGAIIGVGLILAQRKTLKSEVPFGPFLVAGTFIALFWGQKIINWYLNLLYA